MKKNDIITSIILLILGIILLFVPGKILTTVIIIIGALIIASGVLSIFNAIKNGKTSFEVVYGILIGILGIVFITNPQVIGGIIPLILGIWFIIKSAFKLQYVFLLKKDNTTYWIKPLIVNLLTLILGVVLVFNPFKGAETLIRIIAVFILAYAILDIIETTMMRPKKVKVIK